MAKQTVEQVRKMQGNVPGQFQDYIDKLFKQKERVFNWKQYFRRMIGTVIDVELKKTRKKESIRFPDASGLKHKKKSSICVIVDTSGSVSNNELCDFYSEIHHVWKAGANVKIIENDAAIGRIYDYTGKWDCKVTGRGGTVFDEAVEWYNNHRRDFNLVIFFTDGYADVDLPIKGESIWVITSNGNKSNKYPGKTIFIPKNNE
jgi:predicted metal-dependent peptidase